MRLAPLLLCAAVGLHAQDGAERLDPSNAPSPPTASASIRSLQPLDSMPSPSRDSASVPAVPKASDSATPSGSAGISLDSVPNLKPPAAPLALPSPVAPPLSSPASAPRTPEAGVVVRLDTTAPAIAQKSIWLASGLSLLLPGAGEQYLGATGRAKTFFAAELLSVAAAWLSWRTREDALVSARELASRYAQADAQDKSVAFLELMAQYRSRRPVGSRHDSYDEAMLLSGQNPDRQFPLTDSYTWDWGSTENPENDAHLRSFESQLRTYRASKIALSFSLGAMGVSRILSLADVLWLHRRASWIQAEVIPLPQGAAGRLAWRF